MAVREGYCSDQDCCFHLASVHKQSNEGLSPKSTFPEQEWPCHDVTTPLKIWALPPTPEPKTMRFNSSSRTSHVRLICFSLSLLLLRFDLSLFRVGLCLFGLELGQFPFDVFRLIYQVVGEIVLVPSTCA